MDHNSNQQFRQPSLPAPSAMPEPPAGNPVQSHGIPTDGMTGQLATPATSAGSAAVAADDTDIIEPVWVSRVEAVLDGSMQDPRELVQRLSVVKAEYVAQRYGMTLKQGADKR